MAALQGQQVNAVMNGLVIFPNNTGITGSIQYLSDGAGINSVLGLSTTGVTVNGTFKIGTSTLAITTGNVTFANTFTTTSTVSITGAFSTAAATTFAGAFATTITSTATCNSTLPAGTHTLVGLDTTDTLANKTLTNPIINNLLLDTNGNQILNLGATASAVNYIQISNAATSGIPGILSKGSDGTVALGLYPKNNNIIIQDSTSTSSPAIRFYNAAATQYTGLKAATSAASSVTFVLPATDGVVSTTGLFPSSDGSANLSFTGQAWTAWTPTVTGFSGSPTVLGYYQIIGKTCLINISISGTSNTTGFTVTNLPFTAQNTANKSPYITLLGDDSSTLTQIIGQIGNNTTILTLFKGISITAASWTNSGTKALLSSNFFYEIA